jgi:serine/threonine-protein kinase
VLAPTPAPSKDVASPPVHPTEPAIPTSKVAAGDSAGRASGSSASIAVADGPAKPAPSITSDAGTRPPARPVAKPAADVAAPAGEGELVISVKPWAAVWINGKATPDGTPYRGRLPAGRYRIRLANEDNGQSEVISVTIEPNKTKTIERKW